MLRSLLPWWPRTPPACDVFAVRRQTTTGGFDLAPGGLPPAVTLQLDAGKYLVTLKALIMNMSSSGQEITGTFRPIGTAGPWYDLASLRLAPRWQPGEFGDLVLHAVVELSAPGGIDVDIGHTGSQGDIRADNVWLTALRVTNATVTELT